VRERASGASRAKRARSLDARRTGLCGSSIPAMPAAFLELLNEEDRALVLRRSNRVTFPAGTVSHGPPDRPLLAVVESGLIRAFVMSPDRRQASVVYLHPGDTYGMLEFVGPPPAVDLQAVTATTVMELDARNVSGLAETHIGITKAAVRTLSDEIAHLVRIVTVRSLGSMTERLAFDLLERACDTQLREGELVFGVTHEQLAESIGSTREVVTRILGHLRRAGVVVTSPGRVRVVDAERLSLIVRGVLTGTEDPPVR
jgi:CRP-like cAMP-binding protein